MFNLNLVETANGSLLKISKGWKKKQKEKSC